MKGRFLVTLDPDDADRATLDAAGARHVRALRLTRGDRVCAIVGPGEEREAVVESVARDRVRLALGARLQQPPPDPAGERVLAVALGDLARLDLVIEKATELGATAVQVFIAERSQTRSVPATRIERWRRIAGAATEQCGRTRPPDIPPPVGFAEVLAGVRDDGTTWLLTPADVASAPASPGSATGATPDRASPAPASRDTRAPRLLVVGPEGGLGETEVAHLLARGAHPVTLGRRVLRFETAAIAGLAAAAVCDPEDAGVITWHSQGPSGKSGPC